MDRKTKKIITPIEKKEVELKEWITGREYEEIQKPITDIKMLISKMGMVQGELNVGDASQKSVEKAIELIVVSIDGETKGIVEKVKSLHKDDYLFITKEIDKVYKGEDFQRP